MPKDKIKLKNKVELKITFYQVILGEHPIKKYFIIRHFQDLIAAEQSGCYLRFRN